MTNSNNSEDLPSRSGGTNHTPPDLKQAFLSRNQTRFVEAVNRFNRTHDAGPAGIFAALFAQQWLEREIHPAWRGAVLAVSRNPEHQWLARLLAESSSPSALVAAFLDHWTQQPVENPKAQAIAAWRAAHPADPQGAVLDDWRALGIVHTPLQQRIRHIQLAQKETSQEMGGSADRERIARIDTLPTPDDLPPWSKVGFIPRMACSQSCRHCQFVWRDPMKNLPDPMPTLHWIDQTTQSLLFTGGELHDQLPLFERTIRELPHIRAFAILLNGATTTTLEEAESIFHALDEARRVRPKQSAPPEVILQVSFDEYHQEILVNRDGTLHERIPVANIANLLQIAPRHPKIRLVLLHKQTRLNLSGAILEKGVIARLQQELLARGLTLHPLRHAVSPRHKQDPVDPTRTMPVIRDLMFVLSSHPEQPIHLMSSTIDAFGRASLLDRSEFIQERGLLNDLLQHGQTHGERFDIDPMIRADGIVTCFGATHLWMGDLSREPRETVRARFVKDPLLAALARFDRRLIDLHREIATDTDRILATASGPHHVFHQLTETADARRHLTQRLLATL
ncbi:hypothetical protein SIID45300_01224 [Candidatus Magnetaquicoccaceae bacterium FCR-1]|uniref:Radical SAM protein n=1 Tax=Candidatus Magnetaquiglobus chichijimensis TaxID=3141448 RepID=A0ABQ0C7Q1_9PROT